MGKGEELHFTQELPRRNPFADLTPVRTLLPGAALVRPVDSRCLLRSSDASPAKTQSCSKGGHHDSTTRSRAGSGQECDSSVSCECSGSGTDRIAQALQRDP